MITIEKRKIEISIPEFKEEVKELCRLYKRNNPSQIIIGFGILNDHFKLKLNKTDFYILTEQLELRIRYNGWLVDDVLNEI